MSSLTSCLQGGVTLCWVPSPCSSTMAAMGPEDRAGAGPGGTAACPSGLKACVSTTRNSNTPDIQQTLVSISTCAVLLHSPLLLWVNTCNRRCHLSSASSIVVNFFVAVWVYSAYFIPPCETWCNARSDAGSRFLFKLSPWQILLSAGRVPRMDRKYSFPAVFRATAKLSYRLSEAEVISLAQITMYDR